MKEKFAKICEKSKNPFQTKIKNMAPYFRPH